MSDEIEIKEPKDESDKIANPGLRKLYQFLLVVSLGGNIALSAAAYISKANSERLDIEKKRLDNKIANLTLQHAALEDKLRIVNNSPNFSIFRLTYEINSFFRFLESNTQPPFLVENNNFRIVENDIYERVKNDLALIQKRARVRSRLTLLVIANSSSSPAFALKATLSNSSNVLLGDLESHTAILIPIAYQSDENAGKIEADNYKQVAYDIHVLGEPFSRTVQVPPAVATSWSPVINDPAGVGRSAVDDKRDKRLDDVLPP